MDRMEFGKQDSAKVLIRMAGDHELTGLENEVAYIRREAGDDFRMVALKVEDWNRDLSPWKAPAVFGKEAFGGEAEKTLKRVLAQITDPDKTYYLGGYSLAGLFALWAAYQCDVFAGIAAASPSIWFPGFLDHMKERRIHTGRVYLSLGDREEKTRNPLMSTVGNAIRTAENTLTLQGVETVLEWNEGNHFKDADIRTAKAFSWLLRA